MAMVKLSLNQISVDNAMQCREKFDEDAVADYTAAYKAGVKLPPIVVFNDGQARWLGDGFHRYPAAKKAGLKQMQVDERKGTRRDALLFAVGANAAHGLRRSNADKRRAVMVLLKDVEWQKWGDREIARRAGVSHTLVGDFRKEMVVKLATVASAAPRAAGKNKKQGKIAPSTKKHTDVEPENVPDDIFDDQPASKERTPEDTKALGSEYAGHKPSRDIAAAIMGMIKAWEESGQDSHPFISEQSIVAHLKSAASEIRQGQPYAVCPYCKGALNCDGAACKGTGWVPQTIYENAPPEMRADVATRGE